MKTSCKTMIATFLVTVFFLGFGASTDTHADEHGWFFGHSFSPKKKHRPHGNRVAKDVDCYGCIDPNDIARKAVKRRHLDRGAVGTNKIRDGAVTVDKLADDVKALIEQDGGPGDTPGDEMVQVDCNVSGETITQALEQGAKVIEIMGVCNENVTITGDNITLRGISPAGSQIRGVPETDPFVESPITLIGAQKVVIENLTVSGGQSSGIAANGSFLTVRNSVVENNGANGIAVLAGSTARIDNNIVQGNAQHGIVVSAGGFAVIRNNTIQNNQFSGVAAVRSGRADIDNNTIRGNSDNGVFSHLGGSVSLSNNTIAENAVYGVFIDEGSNGRLEGGNTIESDAADFFVGAVAAVYRNSTLRIRGDNNILRNNSPSIFNLDCNSNNSGAFAADVEINSTLRQDGGHATFIGNVEAFNLSTVDLRDVDITGTVFSDTLFTTVRLRDQGRVPGNVTVTGLICFFPGSAIVNIRGAGSADAITVNGQINCNGGGISPPIFNPPGPPNGLVNCN